MEDFFVLTNKLYIAAYAFILLGVAGDIGYFLCLGLFWLAAAWAIDRKLINEQTDYNERHLGER